MGGGSYKGMVFRQPSRGGVLHWIPYLSTVKVDSIQILGDRSVPGDMQGSDCDRHTVIIGNGQGQIMATFVQSSQGDLPATRGVSRRDRGVGRRDRGMGGSRCVGGRDRGMGGSRCAGGRDRGTGGRRCAGRRDRGTGGSRCAGSWDQGTGGSRCASSWDRGMGGSRCAGGRGRGVRSGDHGGISCCRRSDGCFGQGEGRCRCH